MASVPIGGVRIDLQLASAAFLRDIAKTNAAVQANTGRTVKSLGLLQSSVAATSKLLVGFLGVRTIKQVINFTEECLKLAGTIKGPLGIAAREFTDKATAMTNSFKLGVAKGFMDALQEGLKASGVSLQNLASAGIILGNVLGRVFTAIVNFLTHDVPEGVKTSINSINTLITAYNSAAAARDAAAMKPSALAPGAESGLLGPGSVSSSGIIPLIDTSAIESSIKSWTDFANTQGVVAGALQTTAQGQREATAAAEAFNRTVQASEAIYEATRTPLEEYDQALGKIAQAHATGDLAARATAEAQRTLASTYVNAAQQITGTLNQAFEGNKAVQIANALVNAAAGIMQAMTLPFPLNWAQAAAVGALAATQIAAIRSAKPGASGAPKSSTPKGNSGITSAGAASTAAASTASAGDGFTQAVTIEILGDVFGPEHFRKIVEGINGVQRDGTALLRIA